MRRAAALFLFSACTLDPLPQRNDQLDQNGEGDVVWEGDGGVLWEGYVPGGPSLDEEPPAAPHVCRDACPEVCGTGEACCRSTQQCIALDCRECCPDPDFGFDQLALGGR